MMRSTRFDGLVEYARKTESTVVIPQLVLDELSHSYRRELHQKAQAVIRDVQKLNGFISEPLPQVPLPDLDTATAEFVAHVKSRLALGSTSILPYRDDFLVPVLQRAMTRTPPCSDRGEEIRDALIWMTLLEVAKASGEPVALISNNTKQFSGGDGSLHPVLAKEAADGGLTVHFYTSLDDFLRDHSAPLDFITSEWVASAISADTVVDAASSKLLQDAERKLLRYAAREDRLLASYPQLDEHEVTADDYFVNALDDGTYRLEVVWSGWGRVSYDSDEMVEEQEWDYEYGYDQMTGKFGYHPEYRTRTRTRTTTREADVQLLITTECIVHEGKASDLAVLEADVDF